MAENIEDDLYIILYEDPYGELCQENFASARAARIAAYKMTNCGQPATAYKRLKDFQL